MQFLSIKKSKKDDTQPKTDIRQQLNGIIKTINKYQTFMVALAVIVLLGFTFIKMQSFIDPPLDEDKAAENQKSVKLIVIDQKSIERIKQLADSGSKPTSKFVDRSNPFTE